jgi:hypothetical protein
MGYICCLGGFIEPSKSLGGKYEPSEKFRGQKQTLFLKEKLFSINKLEILWNGGQWNHGCVTRASYSSEWKGFHCTRKVKLGLNNNCTQSFQGAI